MLRAARLVWILAAVGVCLWVSCAQAVDIRPRQIGDDTHRFEAKPYQMREDFDGEPFYDCALQYYYYIPCPTYSWFWGYSGWERGDILAARFRLPDQGTGGYDPCDPMTCHELHAIRVLDFAGYGVYYPGLFTVRMDVYCSGNSEEPFEHLWTSGPVETDFGWNYINVNPPNGIELTQCNDHYVDSLSFIVTMTFTGQRAGFTTVGFDNIGTARLVGCEFHESGCMPVYFPRTWMGGREPRVHSGYVGAYPFQYWPPLALPDGVFPVDDPAPSYGFVEVAWRVYLECYGPCKSPAGAEETTWSGVKSLYR